MIETFVSDERLKAWGNKVWGIACLRFILTDLGFDLNKPLRWQYQSKSQGYIQNAWKITQ